MPLKTAVLQEGLAAAGSDTGTSTSDIVSPSSKLSSSWNGMEYVIRAKGPALGLVGSFIADRRMREKKFESEKKAANKIS